MPLNSGDKTDWGSVPFPIPKPLSEYAKASKQRLLDKGYEEMTIRELMARARAWLNPREKGQVQKRQTRYTYNQGPMYYLGQQIVKAMEDAGYPAKIIENYRTPERQSEVYEKGHSKAGPWQSPHQFYEAVDIVHPSLFWAVTPDYWETLATCVRIVAEKYDVQLTHGHYWTFKDSAHIQLKDWKVFREIVRQRWRDETEDWHMMRRHDPLSEQPMPTPTKPTEEELANRFAVVLPNVWKTRPIK